MQKRNALGRGLDSLLPISDIRTEGASAINEIPVDLISPNPEQPRTFFAEDALEELASSIRELGVIQPLSLRLKDDGTYQIIAGERRWRAAQMAGLRSVPAYVRSVSDSELTEMALIENIQREDLNAIEVALTFRKLIDTYHLTQDRLSERVGKKRATIANHLRLLKLPAEIQLGLRDRKLEMGHARALLSVDDPAKQLRLYYMIVRDGLSVRRVEELARMITDDSEDIQEKAEKPAKRPDAFAAEMEKNLSSLFPTPVKFARRADGKGSITLKFSSDDELRSIMALLETVKKDPEE